MFAVAGVLTLGVAAGIVTLRRRGWRLGPTGEASAGESAPAKPARTKAGKRSGCRKKGQYVAATAPTRGKRTNNDEEDAGCMEMPISASAVDDDFD